MNLLPFLALSSMTFDVLGIHVLENKDTLPCPTLKGLIHSRQPI